MLSVLSLSLTINCDVFNVLEDALHCLLENWWSRCNSEWQPVVLEQSLVGVDDYQLLTGIIQGHVLVGVSQIQLDEQTSFCQECKQILNSGDRIRIELGHSVHLGLVVPADSVWGQPTQQTQSDQLFLQSRSGLALAPLLNAAAKGKRHIARPAKMWQCLGVNM